MVDLLIQALDHIDELVVFYEPDFRVAWMNQAVLRWSGKSLSDITGRRCFEVFYGRSEPCLGCLVQKVFKGGEPVQSEHQGADGRMWSVRAYPVRSQDGSLQGVLEISLDLSPMKAAQAALREREKLYSAVLQNIVDGVCVLRGDSWEIEEVNPAFASMVEGAKLSAPGATFLDFVADKDVVHGHLVATLRLGTGRVFETRLQPPSGSTLDVELSLSPLTRQGIPRVVMVCRDLGKRHEAMAEHLRTQKLHALAVMAEGMAHDFNNILAGVVGNLSLAKLDADPESRLYSRLNAAEKACARAEEVLRRLLTFADGGAPKRRAIKADRFMAEHLVPALRALNVPVSMDVSEDLPQIFVDANLLARALADLASEAFLLKGAARIHVEGRLDAQSDMACPTASGPGKKVCFMITAPNVCLNPLELDRIFEPYALRHFAVGKGLGGCTAYAVVRQHGGHLAAVGDDGRGTRLMVCLPVDALEGSSKGEKGAPTKAHDASTGRLLIMDDERIVRETLGEILKLKGFDVTLAADGDEAVALYQSELAKGKPFDAVILDLTVRGGPGAVEVLSALRRLNPHVKAFVASGYTLDPVMIDPMRYGFCGVAPKPFQYDELAAHLRQVISLPSS